MDMLCVCSRSSRPSLWIVLSPVPTSDDAAQLSLLIYKGGLPVITVMLSVYASHGSLVEDKMLRCWIDYIVKDKSDLNIKGAAIMYDNGNEAASTKRFHISTEEFRNLSRTYMDPASDRVLFRDVTYCVKSRNTNQLVCFNGNKYVIVNRTKKTFIITHCVSKHKSIQVAAWINKVAKKLTERRS